MPLPRLSLPRKIGIILAVLVGVYALAGFWLVPRLLVRGLHEYLEVKHQRHVAVGAVRFNPFTLKLEVDHLEIADADGKPMLGFDHLAADVRVRSVLRGGVQLANITLDEPRVRLIERRDGSLNVMDLVPPSDPNSPMPKVWIDALRVNHGEAEYNDLNRATPFQVAVTAFNLELDDFYTRSASNGYRVSARSTHDATFSFAGTFGLDPVASKGELHIGNFRAQSIADAGPNLLPFDVAHGTLDLNGRYDLGPHGTTSGLVLDVSDLTLHDVGLRAPGQQDVWVEVPELQVLDTHIDFAAAAARVGKLHAEGAKINAWIEKDGTLNLTRLYVPLPADPAAAQAPASKPWTFAMPAVEVAAAAVDFTDRGPRRPATFHLAPLTLTLGGYAIPASAPLTVEASTGVNGTGHLSAHGTVGLSPLAGQLALEATALPLPPLQSYIDGKASLQLKSGTLSFHGTTALGADGALAIDGDGSVDRLRTIDDALEEDFVKWTSVALNGLHATTQPLALRIKEVVARQPYARVIVASNGKTNLGVVLHTGTGADADAAAAPAPAPPAKGAARARARATPAKPPMPIEIGIVRVSGGSMNFADFSVKPQFAAGILDLAGTIRGLSSAPDSRAQINLDGKVDRYAPVHIAGELNFLSAESYANVQMNFKNLELTGLSPYSGKFAGYWIDKGKMSAELDYKVEHRKLNANHHIVVNQLTLGQHVDSPDATSLPVRLGIALLKDKDGVIDLELPVTGSLDDPDFRLGKIIWKVVVNLVTKAVTSPFRLLGALFGGGEEMEYVEFRPGDAALDDAARTRAASLVKALEARPGLSIDVPMGVAPDVDTPALAARKFDQDLATRAAAALHAEPGDADALARLRANPAAYRAMLESAYAETFGQKPAVPVAPKGTAADAATSAAIAWLENELRSRITVGARELDALAADRAGAFRSALVDGTTVDPGRVFLVKAPPQQVAGDHVRLKLALHD